MRILYKILITIFILTNCNFSQWIEATLPDITDNLNSVFFLNNDVGYTVGDNGRVIKTTDSGMSWNTINSLQFNCNSIHGYGSKVWAVGNNGKIFVGDRWESQNSKTNIELRDVFFIDTNNGWIVGRGGTILHTTDAGETWNPQNSTSNYDLHSVFFSDAMNGCVVGNGGRIIRTTNGGTSWAVQVVNSIFSYFDVFFIDKNNGWIVGGNNSELTGKILTTTNGGLYWSNNFDTNTDEYLYSIRFFNTNEGIAVGYGGTIYITKNKGAAWEKITNVTDQHLRSVFINSNYATAVGYSGLIINSSDKGEIWGPKKAIVNVDFKSIHFINPEKGWAAGSDGIVIHSTNGGKDWIFQNTGINATINKIQFLDDLNGYCAGDFGLILQTTDGGSSWDTCFFMQPPLILYYFPFGQNYLSMHFTDINSGFAVGYYSNDPFPETAFSSTKNGGMSWESIFEDIPAEFISDIYFMDNKTGFMVSNYTKIFFIAYGWLLRTTDGGETWADISPDTLIKSDPWDTYNEATFESVYFINKDTGWVAGHDYGDPGFIFATTDGGKTWVDQNVDDMYSYTDIQFFDSNIGWAVGHLYWDDQSNLNNIDRISNNDYKNKESVRKNKNIILKGNNHILGKRSSPISKSLVSNLKKSILMKTSNGGLNWSKTEFDTKLNSLCFLDEENGWIAGSGKIYRYAPELNKTIWNSHITITDKFYNSQILEFGQNEIATNSIDLFLGEEELPPVPPSGIFDARFILPENENSLVDYRSKDVHQITWVIKFQPSESGYPIKLSWGASDLPEGFFFLTDIVNGSIVNVNMKEQSNYLLTNTGISSLQITYKKEMCVDVSVNQGWNIISIPFHKNDMSKPLLFPTALSVAFGFENGYKVYDTLNTGFGYWLKFPEAETITLCGMPVYKYISLKAGWNIIGVFDNDINIYDLYEIPSGVISTKYFEYNNGYKTTEILKKGKGYWVKASQEGKLIYQPLITKLQNVEATETLVEMILKVSDGNNSIDLYFGIDSLATEGIDEFLGEQELPPLPPMGVLDARFIIPNSTLSALRDIRYGPEGNIFQKVHQVHYQKGDGQVVSLSWDLPSGIIIRIQDIITGNLIDTTFSSGKGILTINNPDAINKLNLTLTYPSGYTPVEFEAFTAQLKDDKVLLNWKTLTELNNEKFEVERQMGSNSDWELIGSVDGKGTSTNPQAYAFEDNLKFVAYRGNINYRIKQIDYDGTFTYSTVINLNLDLYLKEYYVSQNYPNPFNPSTVIKYGLPIESRVIFEIYNIIGEKLQVLDEGVKDPGYHNLTWQSLNFSSGVYYYTIKAFSGNGEINFLRTQKMTLVK